MDDSIPIPRKRGTPFLLRFCKITTTMFSVVQSAGQKQSIFRVQEFQINLPERSSLA